MANIHFTVEVFIVCRGKVLLRMHPKHKIWCSIGGHIEDNEDPNGAALREVKEEVGLAITLSDEGQQFRTNEKTFRNLVPPVGLNRHTTGDSHEHVTLVYFGVSKTDTVVPEHPHDEWQWVSMEELSGMDLLPNIREYAEGALRALGHAS